jgi:hypothetical protein
MFKVCQIPSVPTKRKHWYLLAIGLLRTSLITHIRNTGCPTRYRTRHFFNNSNTNEDIATKQTHTTKTFLFISHTTNVFKFHCNIFIGVRIIKEMLGSVASGTLCICSCVFCSVFVPLHKARNLFLSLTIHEFMISAKTNIFINILT